MSDLPVLGCAMELHNLENLAPWVLEKDRDLEIQDAYHAFVLDKTADKVADRVRELLGDGYKGRLGIHGPFYGFSLDSVDPAIRKVVRMRLEQALKMGHRMGATQMVLHSPLTLWDRDNMLHMGYEAGKVALVPAAGAAPDEGGADTRTAFGRTFYGGAEERQAVSYWAPP